MRKQILKVLVLGLGVTSLTFGANLKTQMDKESYSIGASTGFAIVNQITRQSKIGVNANKDMVIEGFLDAFKGKVALKDEEIIDLLNARAKKLNDAVEKLKKENLAKNHKIGKEFMASNAKNKNVKTTKSGLQYEILKQGKGEKPKNSSVVVVNYKAYLPDGKVFDDTYKRKMPAHLSMIELIKGLEEGLLLMNEGSKFKLVIPSKLAYGDDAVADIPAGSTVIFELELKKVMKPGGAKNSAKPLENKAK